MLYDNLSAKPRLIFLLDGGGALVSTLLLLLMAYFEDIFGIPKSVLYRLVPITIIFTLFSLGCYVLRPTNWKRYLATIAIANILYCCLTLVLLFYFFRKLTTLGIAYFVIEIFVILLLSRIELRLAYNKGAITNRPM